MNLLLMRHGQAEQQFSTDAARNLTDLGRSEVLKSAARLKTRDLLVERVVASPYVRARQTAELMVAELGLSHVATSDAITPDQNPIDAASALASMFTDCSVVLAVMHQPIISRLILYLTDSEQPMGTADLAIINAPVVEKGCCDLICVL